MVIHTVFDNYISNPKTEANHTGNIMEGLEITNTFQNPQMFGHRIEDIESSGNFLRASSSNRDNEISKNLDHTTENIDVSNNEISENSEHRTENANTSNNLRICSNGENRISENLEHSNLSNNIENNLQDQSISYDVENMI